MKGQAAKGSFLANQAINDSFMAKDSSIIKAITEEDRNYLAFAQIKKACTAIKQPLSLAVHR